MTRQPPHVAGLLAAVLCLTALAGCAKDPTADAAKVRHGPQPPSRGAWMGAAVVPKKDFTPSGQVATIQGFEQVTGRRLDVVHTYHPWHDPFPDRVDEHFLDAGQQLLTGWAGSDCPGIAAGRYDDLIRQRARAVKRLGKPIMMAFRWEMDRPNLRSQVGSAKDFVAAWKHTRKIFADEGATNVGWVWAPTAKGFTEGYAQQYYPGDDQVDWIGVDAYPGSRLESFGEVMQAFMTFAKRRSDKPVMVAEFGVSDRGGRRPGWLKAARAYVKRHPQIKAVVYFDGNTNPWEEAQLSLQSSAPAKKAFNGWLADPYFNQGKRQVTELR